jgi:hypothetical protein
MKANKTPPVTTPFNPKPCPASGAGVHGWVYYACCRAVEAGMSDEEAESKIEALMSRPQNPATEILDALHSARNSTPGIRDRPWPTRNYEQIEAIGLNAHGVAVLQSRSPIQITHNAEIRTEAVIDSLFPGNPLLCAGMTVLGKETKEREKWRLEGNSSFRHQCRNFGA